MLTDKTKTDNLGGTLARASSRVAHTVLSGMLDHLPYRNIVASPTNVLSALGMVYLGSAGQTQKQVAEAIAFDRLGAAEAVQALSALPQISSQLGAAVSHSWATAIWIDSQLSISPAFRAMAERVLRAEVVGADFTRVETAAEINAWAAKSSGGRHGDVCLTGDFPACGSAMLFTTASLLVPWSRPFEPIDTRFGIFTCGDGTSVSLPMMWQAGQYSSLRTDQFHAIGIPLGSGPLRSCLIMPDPGETLRGVLRSLNDQSLRRILWRVCTTSDRDSSIADRTQSLSMELILPRCEARFVGDIAPAIRRANLDHLFRKEEANLLLMGASQGHLEKFGHASVVKLNERGGEHPTPSLIALTTGVSNTHESVVFDRPFLFLVYDIRTELIFLAAAINNPEPDYGVLDNDSAATRSISPEQLVLERAVHKRDVRLAAAALEQGADPNSHLSMGDPPLLLAVRLRDKEMAGTLLAHGADTAAKSLSAQTSLSIAAATGQLETMRLLLDKGAIVDAADDDGKTALLDAASSNQPAAVELLMAHGAQVNRPDHYGATALMYSIGDPALRDLLLGHGADPNLATTRDGVRLIEDGSPAGTTALSLAVRLGLVGDVGRLIAAGAKVDEAPSNCAGPLELAIAGGHSEIVDIVIGHGANVNAKSRIGWPMLCCAASVGHPKIVSSVLLSSQDPNATTPDEQFSPLICASASGHAAACAVLLGGDADWRYSDRFGLNAVMHAVRQGNSEVLRAFVAARVQANAPSIGWPSTVHYLLASPAIWQAWENERRADRWLQIQETMQLLLESSDVVDLQDENGYALVHLGAMYDVLPILQTCIAAGAKLDAVTKLGRTPLLLAVKTNHWEAVKMLLNAGADAHLGDKSGDSAFVAAQNRSDEHLRIFLEAEERGQQKRT